MKFNVNDYVRVKLTNHGRSVLRQQREALLKPYGLPVRLPEEDAAGWSTWQLWSLMQELGHTCGNGAPLTFEPTIEIVQ